MPTVLVAHDEDAESPEASRHRTSAGRAPYQLDTHIVIDRLLGQVLVVAAFVTPKVACALLALCESHRPLASGTLLMLFDKPRKSICTLSIVFGARRSMPLDKRLRGIVTLPIIQLSE